MAKYGVSASRVDKFGAYKFRYRSAINKETAKTAWATQQTLGQNILAVNITSTTSSVTTSLAKVSLSQRQSAVAEAIKGLLAVDLTV